MMKNIFSLLIICFCVYSCKKTNSEGGVIVDMYSDILITNEVGHNLLNPSTQGGFKKEDIKIYYLIDGEKREIVETNLDALA